MSQPSSALKIVQLLASLLRTDIISRFGPDPAGKRLGIYTPLPRALTQGDLEGHISRAPTGLESFTKGEDVASSGEQPIGLYVLPTDLGQQGLTKVAILDLDDKKKNLSWEQLVEVAQRIAAEMERRGYLPWACRSGSGTGIHLWFRFIEPVQAALVRQDMELALVGALGPNKKERVIGVDVFPSQDRLELGVAGNLIALPLGRASRPLNLATGQVHEDLSQWTYTEPPASMPPRPVGQAPSAPTGGDKGDLGPVDVETLRGALKHVPTETYETWRDVGIALKQAVSNGQLTERDAEKLWTDWAASDPTKFSQRAQDYQWARFKPNGTLTLGSVWYLAEQNGWEKPKGGKAGKKKKEKKPRPEGLMPWEDPEAEDFVKALNADYFIAMEAGKLFVFKEEFDDILKRHMLTRMQPTDFKLWHKNKKTITGHTKQGLPIYEEVGSAWLEDECRREYERIVLQPEGSKPNFYNLWRGFTVRESAEGSCDLLKEHMLKNLCRGDDDAFRYLWNWCAQTVQKPHEPIGVAVVLRGAKGVGKGTFANALGTVFGQHYLQVASTQNITGKFNAHLRDAILLYADEAVWAGNKQEEGVLKMIITEPYLPIEGKGRDLVQARNMLHLIISTNNEWSIPASLDERRFFALNVADDKKQDLVYFKQVLTQLRNGGHAKFLHELLNTDLSGFNAFEVPQTEELVRQKLLSLDPVTEWWYEKLVDGELMRQLPNWNSWVPIGALHMDFVQHARLTHPRVAARGVEHLAGKILSLLPTSPLKDRRKLDRDLHLGPESMMAGQRLMHWKLPPLQECRDYFESKARAKLSWEPVHEHDDAGLVPPTRANEEIPF